MDLNALSFISFWLLPSFPQSWLQASNSVIGKTQMRLAPTLKGSFGNTKYIRSPEQRTRTSNILYISTLSLLCRFLAIIGFFTAFSNTDNPSKHGSQARHMQRINGVIPSYKFLFTAPLYPRHRCIH